MEKLGESMQRVLDMIRQQGSVSDKELCAAIDLPDGAIRPARLRLYRRGLVEPDGKGKWITVPPERQEEVREAAATKPPRRRKLDDVGLDERVAIVTALLQDEDVNRVLAESIERRKEWRRARARAKGLHSERENERRERRAQAAQAEKDKSAYVDFLKTRNHLKDAVEVVLGVHRFLEDDFARYEEGEPTRIPAGSWSDVLRNVTELLAVVVATHERLHEVLGEPSDRCPLCGSERRTGPEVIDAEVVTELTELAEG